MSPVRAAREPNEDRTADVSTEGDQTEPGVSGLPLIEVLTLGSGGLHSHTRTHIHTYTHQAPAARVEKFCPTNRTQTQPLQWSNLGHGMVVSVGLQ